MPSVCRFEPSTRFVPRWRLHWFGLGLASALLLAVMFPRELVAQAGSPAADAGAAGISPAGMEELGKMLQAYVDQGRVAGMVAGVARNGKLAYLESFGWQDLEKRQPMRKDSIFQIRSMSKPLTAVAVLQLVEQGKLGLQDPVSDYLPEFRNVFVFINPDEPFLSAERRPDRPITIEHLLLNTAGLSHRNSVLYQQRQVRSRADTLQELSRKVARVPLIGDPGEQWVYSISLTILGRVVEVVSEQPLDAYLQEHVFGPLQMTDTGFFVPAGKVRRLARPYQVNEDDSLARIPEMEIPITENPPLKEGAAGMVSTVPDYLRFLQALLNGGDLEGSRVLRPETVAEMTRNHIPDDLMPIGTNPRRPMEDLGWGYGLAVVVDASRSDFGVNNGEFGWNGSLGTFSWADPQTGTVAVLMLQIQPAGAHGISARFKDLVYSSILE